MEFKDLVYRRRKELGLTMEDVAKAVGVSKATVQRWESGEIENIRRDKIAVLAKALHTTPAYLMGWVENDTSDIELSIHERELILAYREHPEMQNAVDTLLKIMPVATSDDSDFIAKDLAKTVKSTEGLAKVSKKKK